MSGVLVLDCTETPVGYATLRSAVKKIVKQKAFPMAGATIIATYYTSAGAIEIPSIIKLSVVVPVWKFNNTKYPSKSLILARDDYTCQYCGRTKAELKKGEILTIDHVKPQSSFDKPEQANTWTNQVTACFKCNNKKDNKSLAECGMTLLKKPVRPNTITFTLYNKLTAEQKEIVQRYYG